MRSVSCARGARPCPTAPSPRPRPRPRCVLARASPGDGDGGEQPSDDRPASSAEDDTAQRFRDEMKRRGFGDVNPPAGRAPRWAERSQQGKAPPPSLAQSRGLNDDLGGLLPRGLELIKLGFGFGMSFWPFMLAGSVLFTATFYVFGDQFLHTGGYYKRRPGEGGAPAYVLPEALLAEPTVDRMVPFRAPGPAAGE